MTIVAAVTGLAAIDPDGYKRLIPWGMALIIICGIGYFLAEWRERKDASKKEDHRKFIERQEFIARKNQEMRDSQKRR